MRWRSSLLLLVGLLASLLVAAQAKGSSGSYRGTRRGSPRGAPPIIISCFGKPHPKTLTFIHHLARSRARRTGANTKDLERRILRNLTNLTLVC